MILLDIHPEVSDGSVSDDGIPSKTTTQLSTRMLVPDGQAVFLGGLIKHNSNESREGVPVLGDLPAVGRLFSNRSKNLNATEIVVLISPKVINFRESAWNDNKVNQVSRYQKMLNHEKIKSEAKMTQLMDEKVPDQTADESKNSTPSSENYPWYFDL
jgi:type II secretory pathway component GspD/PulD (secretin)